MEKTMLKEEEKEEIKMCIRFKAKRGVKNKG